MVCRNVRVITLVFLFLSIGVVARSHTLRLEDGRFVTAEELVADLKEARVVFIGESHDNLRHHQAQQDIIDALRKAGVDLAIGLEMFRTDNQDVLDRWIQGEMSAFKFKRAFLENWNWWNKYRLLFKYAREKQLPMVGLNLSREINRKVAKEGFSSLSNKEKQELPVVQCFVSDAYRDYIRRSLGRHVIKGKDFENFCEAQLLWDIVMAKNIIEYLAGHPEKKMVVLAGSGHSWKHGIPEQLKNNGEIAWRVILPEAPGSIQRGSVTFNDADYLLIGAGEGALH